MAMAKSCHYWQSLRSHGHKSSFYKYPFSFLYVIAFNKGSHWDHLWITLIFYGHILELYLGYDVDLKFPTFSFIFSRWISNTNFTSKLIWHMLGGDIPSEMSQYWLGLIAFFCWVRMLFLSDINWFGVTFYQSWTGRALCRYCRDSSNFCWVVWL